MQGPCRPKAYDTRPTRNGSVLPVLLTAADADSPAAARTYAMGRECCSASHMSTSSAGQSKSVT